jgi:site-specific DNA-methyltransferase (adenine-specific)
MQMIAIDKVRIGDRKRKLDQTRVAQLAESIGEVGLLNPITVRKDGYLVAGRHRLEACRKLGYIHIQATLLDGSALHAELAEIDENLIRNDLTVLEQGEHLRRRDEILTEMGARAESGAQPGNANAAKNEGDKLSPSFRTTAAIAAEVGLSERDAQRRKQAANLPEPVRDALRDTPTADNQSELLKLSRMPEPEQQAVVEKIVAGEAKTVKDAARAVDREHTQQRAAEVTTDPAWAEKAFRLILADVADGLPDIPDESIDCIITDPPYPQEYIPTYSHLSRVAARVLKPGGSLLAMAGQSYLPDVLARLAEHLTYHWTIAYLTPGGLWFTKGVYAGGWVGDVSRSAVNDNDKAHHDWGQSESGMADLIERFTKPGETLLDPFVGGGTTAVVGVSLARYVIAADVDQAQLDITAGRLAAMAPGRRGSDAT